MKKKIAFVNQRYGEEIVGGSETYTRMIAERLAAAYPEELTVEVLTTKAISFKTWSNGYTKDVEEHNGVTVRRFDTRHNRSRIVQRSTQILMHNLGFHTKDLEELRLKGRGPYAPDLVEYIRQTKDDYDAFIFVTYMYYPTYFGAKEVYEKAFFIPTAHDEEPIYMNIYKELFNGVKGLIYLTEEEKAFAESLFHNEDVPHEVIGMGIDVPKKTDPEAFRKKYGIEGKYLLFAGRIEEGKGCRELLDYFLKYQKELLQDEEPLTLVLMGKSFMELPDRPDVRYLGFVPEEDKFNGIAGAAAVCLPSPHESFSISLLEGMALGRPTIVNGRSRVLKGHVDRSGGGIAYVDYTTFAGAMDQILTPVDGNDAEMRKLTQIGATPEEMGAMAADYVRSTYSWDVVLRRFHDFILEMGDNNG